MDTHTQDNTNQSGQVPSFDFDLDNLEFKPINKGLGFHQKGKEKTQKRATARTVNKTVARPARARNVQSTKAESNISRSSLDSFYNSEPSERINKIDARIDIKSEPDVVSENFLGKAFAAWIIDLGIVAFFLFVTGLFLVLASGINLSLIETVLASNEIYAFGGLLFVFYYYLYFTILDVSGSPGKNTMSIKIVGQDTQPVRMKQLFVRTTVSLLSLPLLGLPLLIDAHGKMSRTKLVKSK